MCYLTFGKLSSFCLISTPQMVGYHSLEERKLPIACGDTPLKRISCTKLLGVHVDQHLTWKTHVDHVLSSSDGTLSVLRRLKRLALFHVRKHLAESLVLSKVNYACSVFHPLPAFQMNRLQRLQNACAGFVTRKFAAVENVVKQIRNISASATTILSKLLVAIRNITEYNSFCHSVKKHLLRKES